MFMSRRPRNHVMYTLSAVNIQQGLLHSVCVYVYVYMYVCVCVCEVQYE